MKKRNEPNRENACARYQMKAFFYGNFFLNSWSVSWYKLSNELNLWPLSIINIGLVFFRTITIFRISVLTANSHSSYGPILCIAGYKINRLPTFQPHHLSSVIIHSSYLIRVGKLLLLYSVQTCPKTYKLPPHTPAFSRISPNLLDFKVSQPLLPWFLSPPGHSPCRSPLGDWHR